MQFEDGTYVVRFQTPIGSGAGVIYMAGGRARGGDGMMAYTGSYAVTGGRLSADIRATKHTDDPDMASVFGVDEVDIHLDGTASGDGTASVRGTSPQAPQLSFTATLTRLFD